MWTIIATLAYSAEPVCSAWGDAGAREVAQLDDSQSSGLVYVDDLGGALFTMDDHGGTPQLFAFTPEGEYLGAQEVGGATNTDWEDLGSGPCPAAVDADTCIFVADIGDNDENRASLVIWVVPASLDARVTAVGCPVAYDDGQARDAEALLVDPDGEVRVVTKEADAEAKVYLAGPLACGAEPQPMTREAELQLDGAVTGGAMSADGTLVALRTGKGAWIWRGCALDWAAAPEELALSGQAQGEAITFGPDATIYTSSEGSPLAFDVRPCAASDALSCDEDDACGCGDDGGAAGVVLVGVAALRRRALTRSRGRETSSAPSRR